MFLVPSNAATTGAVCAKACLGRERVSCPLLAVWPDTGRSAIALNDGYQLGHAHWLLDVNTATRRHIGLEGWCCPQASLGNYLASDTSRRRSCEESSMSGATLWPELPAGVRYARSKNTKLRGFTPTGRATCHQVAAVGSEHAGTCVTILAWSCACQGPRCARSWRRPDRTPSLRWYSCCGRLPRSAHPSRPAFLPKQGLCSKQQYSGYC
jgi:hypothetical protein